MLDTVNSSNANGRLGTALKRIENIPVDLIKPNPYQPRQSFSMQGLEELAQSIREYGIIQPITVRQTNLYSYELIAGERRLRACKLAGLNYIPAIITNTYEEDSAIIAMIENLQRENLHYLEEAKGYASLIHDHGLTQEELASKLGRNQSTIANKLRILRLSEDVKNLLIKEKLTERHARALLKLPDHGLQVKAIKEVVEKRLNVRDTEKIIESIIEKIESNQKNKEGRQKGRKKLFHSSRDIRIVINTISKAVNVIKEYGIAVSYSQIDKGNNIEIKISIPKN